METEITIAKTTKGSSRWKLYAPSLNDIPYEQLDTIKGLKKVLVSVPEDMDENTKRLIEQRINNFYNARVQTPPPRKTGGEMSEFLNNVDVDQRALDYLFNTHWK